MKLFKLILGSCVAAMIALVSAPASAGYGTLTFNGVTFEMYSSGNTLTLLISNAQNATGNWSGATILDSFAVGGISAQSATITSNYGSWSVATGGLAHGGCNGSGASYFCFSQTGTLQTIPTGTMQFNMTFSGSSVDVSYPTLKVMWLAGANDTTALGSLMSLPIPEPEIYAMMAIGLGVLGWSVRRKKLNQVGAA